MYTNPYVLSMHACVYVCIRTQTRARVHKCAHEKGNMCVRVCIEVYSRLCCLCRAFAPSHGTQNGFDMMKRVKTQG